MHELKPGPPYECKLLKPSNKKNHVEPNKNDKFVAKTYTFDITKCDKIFDLLVIWTNYNTSWPKKSSIRTNEKESSL